MVEFKTRKRFMTQLSAKSSIFFIIKKIKITMKLIVVFFSGSKDIGKTVKEKLRGWSCRFPSSDMARLCAQPFFIRDRWRLKEVGPHL